MFYLFRKVEFTIQVLYPSSTTTTTTPPINAKKQKSLWQKKLAEVLLINCHPDKKNLEPVAGLMVRVHLN